MKKKLRYGSDDIITVYKFMLLCGLECPTKGNIKVSHEIMLGKLKDRHEKFPTKVKVPLAVPFKRIAKDDVKRGKTILVVDDCKQIRAYSLNRYLDLDEFSGKEREEIRNRIIAEYEAEPVDDTPKPGYVKYLRRKGKKD